jgi:hypothetical protein
MNVTMTIVTALAISASIVGAANAQGSWSSDVVVPGTKWVYNVQSAQGRAVQCQVELAVGDGDTKRIITFAILSKGTPVIALRDELMRNQLGDRLWIIGRNYNVLLDPGDKPWIKLESEIIDDEMILIPLPRNQPELLHRIYSAKRLYFFVGGLATGGFDVPGLSQAIEQLNKCPIPH